MLNTATEIEAPSRYDTIRSLIHMCLEIGIGAQTLISLADRASDDFASTTENHDGEGFAHSVDFIAKEIERRADIVKNSLDRESIKSRQVRPNGPTKALKDILLERIEGWKAFSEAPDENAEPERYAAAEKTLHSGDNAADEAISRLGAKSLEACLAKLIIDVGPGINRELKRASIEAETAAAALEWFGLREMYDEYFPGKEAALA